MLALLLRASGAKRTDKSIRLRAKTRPWRSKYPRSPSTEMVALENFLRLSDDQLAAMAEAIDRVRKMSPDERRRLERQIARLSQVARPRNVSGSAPDGSRNKDWKDWRKMMQSLSEEERSTIQSSLQAMPFRRTGRSQARHSWKFGDPSRKHQRSNFSFFSFRK